MKPRRKVRFVVGPGSSTLYSAVPEIQVLLRAYNGWHTRAIAADLHLTEGQVNYRIKRGLAIGARKRFRDHSTWVSSSALIATAPRLIKYFKQDLNGKY